MKTRLLTTMLICAMFSCALFAQYASFPFDTDVLDDLEAMNATPSTTGLTFVNTSKGDVLEMDGVNGFLTLDNTAYNFEALTYSIWFQWNNTNSNPWWQRIFDFGVASDPAPGNHDVMFMTTFQDGKLSWHIHSVNWTDGADTVLNSKEAITVGKWYLLTITHNQDSVKLYLDGSLQGAKASSIKPNQLSFTTCYIGKSNWPDNLFQGRFDEFKIWDRVLTAAEVAAMYVPVSGVNDLTDNKMLIYSVNNTIKIESENEALLNSASVYNIQGVEVYNNTNLGSFTEISNLETGIYIVKVSNTNNVSIKKVLVR